MEANVVVGALQLLASHTEQDTTITATKAREQFFPLLETVMADPTAVVLVEHKGLGGKAMLVGEAYRAYVRQLESTIRHMISSGEGRMFQLAGSMSVAGSVAGAGSTKRSGGEDTAAVLAALRAEQSARAARKLDDIR